MKNTCFAMQKAPVRCRACCCRHNNKELPSPVTSGYAKPTVTADEVTDVQLHKTRLPRDQLDTSFCCVHLPKASGAMAFLQILGTFKRSDSKMENSEQPYQKLLCMFSGTCLKM